MTYKAKVAIYSETRTEHSMQSERHVEFLNVKPCGTERNRLALKGLTTDVYHYSNSRKTYLHLKGASL